MPGTDGEAQTSDQPIVPTAEDGPPPEQEAPAEKPPSQTSVAAPAKTQVKAPAPVDKPPEQEQAPAQERLSEQERLRLRLDETQTELVGQKIAAARADARSRAYAYMNRELGVVNLEEARRLVSEARDKRASNDATVQDVETRLEGFKVDSDQRIEAIRRDATAAQARADQMLGVAEQALRIAALRVEAIKHGFLDPDDPSRYLDTGSFVVNLEQQSVSGVEEAVTQLATDRPHLLRAPSQTTPQPPQPSATTLTPPAPGINRPAPPPAVPPTPAAPNVDALQGQLAEEGRRQTRELVNNF